MMILKRFHGRTIEQAMNAATRALGEEALLLSATRLPSVHAAEIRYEVTVQAPKGEHGPSRREQASMCAIRRGLIEIEQCLDADGVSSDPASTSDYRQPAADRQGSHARAWTGKELHASIADASVVAFVGPTGAGKTMACAKLLFTHGLADPRACRWVTVESGRIGESMLAKAIAGLMGIPFASTELGGSLPLGESQVGSELVFLDVSSFCASDVARLNDLHNVLTSVQRLLLFFTVDARWSSANLAAACRRFSPLHPDALIANMADEAGSLCAVEELAIAANLPIALFGVGTSIPEHMASAHDYLERRSRIPETATAPAA